NLTEQLRRFLEDQAWLENRRVLDLVRTVEQAAIQVRAQPPDDLGIRIDEPGLPIVLPFERPLHDPQPEAAVDSLIAPAPDEEPEYESLFAQQFIDTARLAENIRAIVPPRSTTELTEILGFYPIKQGAAEILGYLSLDDDDLEISLNDEEHMSIEFVDADGKSRRATLPRVTVTRR